MKYFGFVISAEEFKVKKMRTTVLQAERKRQTTVTVCFSYFPIVGKQFSFLFSHM